MTLKEYVPKDKYDKLLKQKNNYFRLTLELRKDLEYLKKEYSKLLSDRIQVQNAFDIAIGEINKLKDKKSNNLCEQERDALRKINKRLGKEIRELEKDKLTILKEIEFALRENLTFWECNQCRTMWINGNRPAICDCGNNMGSNSTKRKIIETYDLERFRLKLMEEQ